MRLKASVFAPVVQSIKFIYPYTKLFLLFFQTWLELHVETFHSIIPVDYNFDVFRRPCPATYDRSDQFLL